ncbi:MAG: hypothetical protein ACK4L7_03125, partial [Flavobacteriales bacterium]
MRRHLVTLAMAAIAAGAAAQAEGAGGLSFARTVSVPLNGLLLHDRAAEAWTWTFGREPGARVLRMDRGQGV